MKRFDVFSPKIKRQGRNDEGKDIKILFFLFGLKTRSEFKNDIKKLNRGYLFFRMSSVTYSINITVGTVKHRELHLNKVLQTLVNEANVNCYFN